MDVVSQILFTTNTDITYEISMGYTKESLHHSINNERLGSDRLVVTKLNTLDLWKLPVQLAPSDRRRRRKHLVILTHGLHSNLTVDMEYIMEQIYKSQDNYPNEQIVVDGYPGNICQTERGVKYLGERLAKYIVNELYDASIVKISFIGHSLGGLVQTFAIAYINVKYPWFFQKVQPINFIAMASPLLGIVTDNPAYVKLLLSFGVIGKTGQDLGLDRVSETDRPLLYLLPGEPTRSVLLKFKRRTLYANAINDGIVPLYTASLLFLDYDDILEQLHKNEDEELAKDEQNVTIPENTASFNKNFISPLTKMLSIWAPQKFPQGPDSKLPKVSMLQSATSILLPPLPDQEYLLNPKARHPVIIHDKTYTQEDLPKGDTELEDTFFNSENMLLQAFTDIKAGRKRYQKLEESIARRWHEGMSWRKVVVALKPDAHNNIIVRRRFANAYGWNVIDHLIGVHFNGDDRLEEEQTKAGLEAPLPNDQSSVIEPIDEYAWVTKAESES